SPPTSGYCVRPRAPRSRARGPIRGSSRTTPAREREQSLLPRWASPRECGRRSIGHFLEGRPERVRRIDAEDFHFPGVERKLLEGEYELAILRVTFDIGVELRGEEVSFDHVAFKLGHIDAVGGETPERLVERGRYVAHAKHERRDDRAVAALCPTGFA